MKICTQCKATKEDIDFYQKGKENRTSSWCKTCFNVYCMKRWTDRKLRIIQQFGNCCSDCKQTYHYSVYEFHHLDSATKDYSWTKMRLMSEIKMQKELTKCVMLCANCHRIRHWDK